MTNDQTELGGFVHYFSNEPVEGDLKFLTEPIFPIQVGIHEPKEDRTSKMHFHKFFVEFFYVERGYITITFADSRFEHEVTKTINQGESFLMFPGVAHTVFLPKGCRVLEVHQGPYVDDKIWK